MHGECLGTPCRKLDLKPGRDHGKGDRKGSKGLGAEGEGVSDVVAEGSRQHAPERAYVDHTGDAAKQRTSEVDELLGSEVPRHERFDGEGENMSGEVAFFGGICEGGQAVVC